MLCLTSIVQRAVWFETVIRRLFRPLIYPWCLGDSPGFHAPRPHLHPAVPFELQLARYFAQGRRSKELPGTIDQPPDVCLVPGLPGGGSPGSRQELARVCERCDLGSSIRDLRRYCYPGATNRAKLWEHLYQLVGCESLGGDSDGVIDRALQRADHLVEDFCLSNYGPLDGPTLEGQSVEEGGAFVH